MYCTLINFFQIHAVQSMLDNSAHENSPNLKINEWTQYACFHPALCDQPNVIGNVEGEILQNVRAVYAYHQIPV